MRIAAVVIGMAGCTTEPDVVQYDKGTACLHADLSTVDRLVQNFTVAAPIAVSVTAASGSCDLDRRTACSAERVGTTLHITSVASWSYPPDDGRLCTRELVPLTAMCARESLAAGEYSVTFGDATMSLVVPSTIERPCMWN